METIFRLFLRFLSTLFVLLSIYPTNYWKELYYIVIKLESYLYSISTISYLSTKWRITAYFVFLTKMSHYARGSKKHFRWGITLKTLEWLHAVSLKIGKRAWHPMKIVAMTRQSQNVRILQSRIPWHLDVLPMWEIIQTRSQQSRAMNTERESADVLPVRNIRLRKPKMPRNAPDFELRLTSSTFSPAFSSLHWKIPRLRIV